MRSNRPNRNPLDPKVCWLHFQHLFLESISCSVQPQDVDALCKEFFYLPKKYQKWCSTRSTQEILIHCEISVLVNPGAKKKVLGAGIQNFRECETCPTDWLPENLPQDSYLGPNDVVRSSISLKHVESSPCFGKLGQVEFD